MLAQIDSGEDQQQGKPGSGRRYLCQKQPTPEYREQRHQIADLGHEGCARIADDLETQEIGQRGGKQSQEKQCQQCGGLRLQRPGLVDQQRRGHHITGGAGQHNGTAGQCGYGSDPAGQDAGNPVAGGSSDHRDLAHQRGRVTVQGIVTHQSRHAGESQ